MEPDAKIQIHYIDEAFYMNDIEMIKKLRTTYHLVAVPLIQIKPMIETLFVLDKYSVAYLLQFYPDSFVISGSYESFIQETQQEFKTTVFFDLLKKGNYVLSGSKYGADFAVYSDDPLFVHASALIFVLEQQQGLDKFNPIELNRVSTIAKKDCVIAYLKKEMEDSKEYHVQYDCIARCAVSWHKTEEGKRRKKQK